MTRLFLTCLGGMLLLLPLRIQADPVPPASSGEAAECRELLELCKAVRRQAALIHKQQAKVKRTIDAQHKAEQKRMASWEKWRKTQDQRHAPPAKAVNDVEKYERATAKESQAVQDVRQAEDSHNAEVELYHKRLQAAQEAASAMRAKHATMPACSQQCADVLNLEELQ